ncbi:MAG: LLM class flavin-dependent oxidoreductase [Proteobacteria bacterium]|nr:LLM class flavin-dependent oxidoreductase [Pseudomonadota bacterium]
MEIGVDSFAAIMPGAATAETLSPADRLANLLDEIEVADRAGLDVFGVGEHHRPEFLDSAPAIILAAAAVRTKTIRLTSAVTVLSAADPVRVFQEFATLDLISKGRAELVIGRGSFGEAYPLFGMRFEDYDALFVEKTELLLKIRESTNVNWSGKFRPALSGQGIYPRPYQDVLPVWIGVGGTPKSFARAGELGLPLMVAIIGGEFRRFRPLVDLYRQAYARAGHPPEHMRVGVHAMGFVAETPTQAKDIFFPGWARMFTDIGRERGWSPVSRAQFEVMCGPGGSFLIGDPATVATKILEASVALGGVNRFTFQMSSASAEFAAMRKSIELLGSEVTPAVRRSLAK